ncbi:S-methyl-5-thioribose-1-phosphate isomerase [Synechococcus sp. RSCCF101]|uniref:S-methyl-5-thioribose-1-phosphate isomerase n=1 Tax=Synechococcus sp. RSCCF101 TaxID=2511069 RepID=UPI0012445C3A|nr:S-methyl-5-thioribose-1-phosphate isomerase [Synechococcus sp. RSCCF101]QEY32100.1 S-methyl-5-thioribose-1-phosphate isomerase [Synechococcus sp. RSCCF101]
MTLPPSLIWRSDHLDLLDQRCLPQQEIRLKLRTPESVADAIRAMAVRGAPAIGLAGAWGLVLAARQGRELPEAASMLRASRPTAVNLAWALDRMLEASSSDPERLALVAGRLADEERERSERLVAHGVRLVPEGASVLHHCHTGAIATGAGVGTALGVIAAAHRQGRLRQAWLDETRPRLQGAALSAWELQQLGVPCTVLVDGASGLLMRQRRVDLVMVGCDRVADNGDVANKIGTYNLALVARAHGLPFYVCAPRSSIDTATASGGAIPIEERPAREITHWRDTAMAAPGARIWNPAFDITPAELVTGLITEDGVLRPPFPGGLGQALDRIGSTRACDQAGA